MYGEPRKVVLSGLVVGAVAIAAYVSPSGRQWLSADEPGVGSGGESARHTRGDIMSGAITSGPVVVRGAPDAVLSSELQAARSSLQRNDFGAAQAQLDAVAATHKNDGQVAALQREVQVRAQASQQAQVVAQEDPKATRTSPSLPAKGIIRVNATMRLAIIQAVRPVTRPNDALWKPRRRTLQAIAWRAATCRLMSPL